HMPSRNTLLAYMSGAPDARATSLLWWIGAKSLPAPAATTSRCTVIGNRSGGSCSPSDTSSQYRCTDQSGTCVSLSARHVVVDPEPDPDDQHVVLVADLGSPGQERPPADAGLLRHHRE